MADISKRKEAEQNSEKDQDKDCHQHKKRKTENESSVIEPLSSFEGFKIGKVLSENAQSKTLFLQGKFGKVDEDAVVLLEKTPFSLDTLPKVLSAGTSLTVDFKNDIYSQYLCQPPADVNAIKTTVIYPATSKHIEKYSSQQSYLIYESPKDYYKTTLPYIERQSFSIQWVYNILEKKAETERIVFEDADADTGFVLLPDMKWDQKQLENMYLVAICHKRALKSLRDLDGSHLPLLKNILTKGTEAIKKRYGVNASQLRVYLHYQPSYYHLHVHFTHLKFDALGSYCGKAHLLQDVIDNIQTIDPLYYQKKTLACVLREKDKLFKCYQDAGRV